MYITLATPRGVFTPTNIIEFLIGHFIVVITPAFKIENMLGERLIFFSERNTNSYKIYIKLLFQRANHPLSGKAVEDHLHLEFEGGGHLHLHGLHHGHGFG